MSQVLLPKPQPPAQFNDDLRILRLPSVPTSRKQLYAAVVEEWPALDPHWPHRQDWDWPQVHAYRRLHQHLS